MTLKLANLPRRQHPIKQHHLLQIRSQNLLTLEETNHKDLTRDSRTSPQGEKMDLDNQIQTTKWHWGGYHMNQVHNPLNQQRAETKLQNHNQGQFRSSLTNRTRNHRPEKDPDNQLKPTMHLTHQELYLHKEQLQGWARQPRTDDGRGWNVNKCDTRLRSTNLRHWSPMNCLNHRRLFLTMILVKPKPKTRQRLMESWNILNLTRRTCWPSLTIPNGHRNHCWWSWTTWFMYLSLAWKPELGPTKTETIWNTFSKMSWDSWFWHSMTWPGARLMLYATMLPVETTAGAHLLCWPCSLTETTSGCLPKTDKWSWNGLQISISMADGVPPWHWSQKFLSFRYRVLFCFLAGVT